MGTSRFSPRVPAHDRPVDPVGRGVAVLGEQEHLREGAVLHVREDAFARSSRSVIRTSCGKSHGLSAPSSSRKWLSRVRLATANDDCLQALRR